MSTTTTDPLVGRVVDGRYEVVARIARGGMATVYLAVDRRLDREVALKVMLPHLAEGAAGADFVARFRREARTAARLAHPGLVAVYDQGVDGETSYLTMEYVDGVNLRRRLAERGALTVGEALSICERVLDALAVAHRADLVHRDIKPENVLLAADGRVKLADFGLARAVTEVTSTTTGTVLGTVAYLAPELVSQGVSDARTDVYACGVLLYEMITGRQPFVGSTPIHVAFQHVSQDVPAPSQAAPWLPVEVDELVGALVARDPAERVPDAAAALALLRRTRAGLDAATLDRHADVAPSVTLPAATAVGGDGDDAPTSPDDQPTTRLESAAGATVALPIGLGLPAPYVPAATPPRRRRRRTVLTVLAIVLAVAAAAFASWWFLLGPGSPTSVPTVAGMTQAQATAALTKADLRTATTEAFDGTMAKGSVLRTTPGPGTSVARQSTVTIVVSKGPDWVQVPDHLVGMTSQAAQAALTAAGLAPLLAGDSYDDKAPAGTVLAATLPDQTPATASAKATRGTTVALVLSKGPAPVSLPALAGMTVDEATKLLARDALTLATTQAYSDTVPAGQIISQELAPGATVHRGDTVNAVVSQGPQLFAVPNLTNSQYSDAKKALEALGLKADRKNVFGGVLGVVRAQSIDPGQMVPKGTVVTLTVV